MRKLGLEVGKDYEVNHRKKTVKYSVKDDYSILALVILLERKFQSIQVCQILGITINELRGIIRKAKKKGLLDSKNNISKMGLILINELKNKTKPLKFRENDLLEPKPDNIFVPKSFDNKT